MLFRVEKRLRDALVGKIVEGINAQASQQRARFIRRVTGSKTPFIHLRSLREITLGAGGALTAIRLLMLAAPLPTKTCFMNWRKKKTQSYEDYEKMFNHITCYYITSRNSLCQEGRHRGVLSKFSCAPM